MYHLALTAHKAAFCLYAVVTHVCLSVCLSEVFARPQGGSERAVFAQTARLGTVKNQRSTPWIGTKRVRVAEA